MFDSLRHWIAVLVVISLPPALLYWFLLHPFMNFWRRLGPVATFSLSLIILISGILGLAQWRDQLIGRDLGTNPYLVVSAIVLGTISIVIMRHRRRFLTTQILVGMPEFESTGKGGKLLQEGVYSVIRHPRYVEIVFGTLAYALVANHTGSYLVALGTGLFIFPLIWFEDRELEQRFGDEYRAYKKRVPAFIPRFR